MDRYKIIKKGIFQSVKSFEEQINSLSAEGWSAKSMTAYGNNLYVLLERNR